MVHRESCAKLDGQVRKDGRGKITSEGLTYDFVATLWTFSIVLPLRPLLLFASDEGFAEAGV